MKNYYEILEVSEKASSEVIEKAYKALVKKYHPDLQPDDKKKEAEEKIKEINEAYETLSDKIKKADYDNTLNTQKENEYRAKYAQQSTQNHQNKPNNSTQNNNNTNSNDNSSTTSYHPKRVVRQPKYNNHYENNYNDAQEKYNQDFNKVYNDALNDAYNQAFNQAYINNLKNMGFDIKYERTFMEKVKLFFSSVCGIFVLLIICFILWHIPSIKNYCIDLYNNNPIIKLIVDIIGKIIKGLIELFKNK